MILFNGEKCMDICLKNTNSYVRLAVEDLRKDFTRVSRSGVLPRLTDTESDNCMVIEENKADCRNPIEGERFSIKSGHGTIRIQADSYLGTMWGIYTFCERYLGVDPCYLFQDLEIEKKDILEVDSIDVEDGPESFGFRGVFLNDEDLLTGWRDGGGIRYLPYPFYGLTVEESAMEMVVETILRLRLNLVIPASFLDLDNPPEKLLADCVARRGIYLTQHHLEPLGLSAFTFDNYCRKYGKTGEFSYLKCPGEMEEAWRFYVEKWAGYENVVWQTGLRGKADRPVWEEDTPSDEELRRYGAYISQAMARQKEIVLEVTGGRARYFTSTLWMEGSLLLEKGFLEMPEGTSMIFADSGPDQMYGPDYDRVPRRENVRYGIYYHLQYYGAGPHLAPQTGLDKLYYNVKRAWDKGDTSYFIVNGSNIREFVFELGACARMLWDVEGFSKEAYLDRYCERYGVYADGAKRLIVAYYRELPELEVHCLSRYYAKYFNYSYEKAPDGIKSFVLKDGAVLELGNRILCHFHEKMEDDLVPDFYRELKKVLPRYVEICHGFEQLAGRLPEPVKKHTKVKWLLYASTLRYIYEWYVNLYEAKQYCDLYESEKMKTSLNAACRSLERYLEYRKCAEYGIFKNWYRGDLKMNVKQKLYDTRRALCQTPDFDTGYSSHVSQVGSNSMLA